MITISSHPLCIACRGFGIGCACTQRYCLSLYTNQLYLATNIDHCAVLAQPNPCSLNGHLQHYFISAIVVMGHQTEKTQDITSHQSCRWSSRCDTAKRSSCNSHIYTTRIVPTKYRRCTIGSAQSEASMDKCFRIPCAIAYAYPHTAFRVRQQAIVLCVNRPI